MVHDFEIQAMEFGSFKHWFILSPTQWVGYEPLVELEWNEVPFADGNENVIPPGEKGVYTFVLCPSIANHNKISYLLYVGMTINQDFKTRFKQYLRDRDTSKPRRKHITVMLTKWDGYLQFCYAKIDDTTKIFETEQRLQAAYIPPFIRTYPSQIRGAMQVLR